MTHQLLGGDVRSCSARAAVAIASIQVRGVERGADTIHSRECEFGICIDCHDQKNT